MSEVWGRTALQQCPWQRDKQAGPVRAFDAFERAVDDYQCLDTCVPAPSLDVHAYFAAVRCQRFDDCAPPSSSCSGRVRKLRKSPDRYPKYFVNAELRPTVRGLPLWPRVRAPACSSGAPRPSRRSI